MEKCRQWYKVYRDEMSQAMSRNDDSADEVIQRCQQVSSPHGSRVDWSRGNRLHKQTSIYSETVFCVCVRSFMVLQGLKTARKVWKSFIRKPWHFTRLFTITQPKRKAFQDAGLLGRLQGRSCADYIRRRNL